MRLQTFSRNCLVIGGFTSLILIHLLLYQNNTTYVTVNPSIDIDFSNHYREENVDLRILVLTFNRHKSLKRLLNSLKSGLYFADKVALEVWIDRSTSDEIDSHTYMIASSFVFDKGTYNVFNHSRHVGIYGQWMGLWPVTPDTKEIAVILEDDMIVSPIFYRYLKTVYKVYGSVDMINGFALHCSMNHYTGKGFISASNEHSVFLYPIIGTWGFSPKLKQWSKFIKWYRSIHKDKKFQPFVPSIIPTKWYMGLLKSGKADSMWEMWHIYFSWIEKQYTLYPNFPNCSSLTRNFREIGLHYSKESKIIDPMVTDWDDRYNHLPENPTILHRY